MNIRTRLCTKQDNMYEINEEEKINMATILLDKFDFAREIITQDEAAMLIESSIYTCFFDGVNSYVPIRYDMLHKIPISAKKFRNKLITKEEFCSEDIRYQKLLINIKLDGRSVFIVNIVKKIEQDVYLESYQNEVEKLKLNGLIEDENEEKDNENSQGSENDEIVTSSSGTVGYGLDLI